MTLVGDTGIKPTVNGSMAFDFKTGKLYWAAKNADSSSIYEVNLETAQPTKVMDVPDNKQMAGIYIPKPLAEDNAPAAATDLKYEFTGGNLTGKLTFTIPAETFNGDATTGPVNYSVTVGDAEPITGASEFGETVSVDITVASSGTYTSTVFLSNDAGDSPVAKVEGYIGYGVPVAPTNVALAYEDGKMNLSWDAVTEVVDNNGYLGTVKYKVTRKVGDETTVVAEDLTTNSYQEEVAEPESGIETYIYTVEAANEEFSSTNNNSVRQIIGSISLPYKNEFSTREDFDTMTGINGEPSSSTWVYQTTNKNVTLSWQSSYDKDDYLIAPPVKLEKDKKYTVSVTASSSNASFLEQIKLVWGLDPSAEGMDNVISEFNEVPTVATVCSGSFTADANVIAYIGVHACSPKSYRNLTIDDFEIKEDTTVGVESVVSAEEMKGDIVSVSGVVVRHGATASDLNSLPKGIYIFGNKKVVVK